jgi:tRNA(fMet)-specific endonuclease VapC
VKYILDTNFVSALMADDERALAKLASVQRPDVGVPQPVFAEIAYGLSRLSNSKRKQALKQRFELLRSVLLIAPWTNAVTDAFGQIKATLEREGKRIEDLDAAIAAHATAHGAVLVTSTTKHMARIADLEVENWLAEHEER